MAVRDKTLLVFIGFDLLFLACAGLLIGVPLATRASINRGPSIKTIAENLLLNGCPLTTTTVNGILMAVTFLVSIPAFFLKENRAALMLHCWLVVVCAMFTLGVGLAIWFTTLRTRKHIAPIWAEQNTLVLSMLQHKFRCCGFQDPTKFVMDDICPNAADAARNGLCVGPFSAFANQFLDVMFTAMFGICAVDGFLVLSALCVLKDRSEKARYKLIDQKNRFGGI